MKPVNENVRLLKPFLRGLPVIVLVIALSVMAAKRYLKYATPMYESTAKIRLADTKDGSPSANLYKDFDIFANANKIGAELEVIKSKVLMSKALDSLDFDITTYRVGKMRKIELYHDCPFSVSASFRNEKWYDKTFTLFINPDSSFRLIVPGRIEPIKGRLDSSLFIEDNLIKIGKNSVLMQRRPGINLADHYEFIIHSRQKLVDMVLSGLDITSIDKEIPILRINYKSPVAGKAADLVNRLAQTYVDDYLETKYQSADVTVDFLNEQLKSVGGKLSASEQAIRNYRDQKSIINLRQETETDLRKIADMKIQQTNARMSLEAIEDLYRYMQSGRDHALELAPNFEAYTDLLATEMVKKMKVLQAEKKDLLLKYTPEHEQVKAIDDKLRDITTYLEEGINNSRKNLKVKYERLTRDIEEAEKVFIGLPEKERVMGTLNREFMLNEQAYNFLHEKRTEAQIARSADISFHRIISPADVPSAPVSPNHTLITVLAAFLGFLGSVLLIYTIHGVKGKVNDATTIERNAATPVAGGIPYLPKTGDQVSYFHKLALQLEIKGLLPAKGLVTISSFKNKEGKSYIATHLARELSMQGKNVLLIDMDDAVMTTLEGVEILRKSSLSDFYNPATIREKIQGWKGVYDHILVKNESISQAANGYLLLSEADANLFVFDSRRTPANMVSEAEVLKEEYSLPNMQFLLNREHYNPNILTQLYKIIRHFPYKYPSIKAIKALFA